MPKTRRGNPPKHTQLKKGVSGNKNGLPKGPPNLGLVAHGSGPRSGYSHDPAAIASLPPGDGDLEGARLFPAQSMRGATKLPSV